MIDVAICDDEIDELKKNSTIVSTTMEGLNLPF